MSQPSMNMGVQVGIKQLKVGETYVLSSDVTLGEPEHKHIRVKRVAPIEIAPGYYVIDMDVLNDDLTTVKEEATIIANPTEKRPIHLFYKLKSSTSGGKTRRNKRSKRTRSRRNR